MIKILFIEDTHLMISKGKVLTMDRREKYLELCKEFNITPKAHLYK